MFSPKEVELMAGRLMLRTLAKDALAGGFDDNEVQALAEAFDEAWKRTGRRW